METTRRECLKIGLLAGAGAALGGCSLVGRRVAAITDAPPTPPRAATRPEVRLLNRLGFGPGRASLASLETMGKDAYIEQQLEGSLAEDPGLLIQLQQLDVLQLQAPELWDMPFDRILQQLQQAAILQAVYGKNQLKERMVDFWTNHFNIYARKGDVGYAKGLEETRIIRKGALGKFSDLVFDMAHSPAMLEFLDNQKNVKGVANENYARELMELHTLGLHGGYSQKDVQEVARCFTGWTIENRFLRPKGRFRFDPDLHDDGRKVVLGHVIPAGGGESDGETVLRIVANHPSTARFLATKLSMYFLGEADGKWVDAMAAEYLRTGTSIPGTLSPMLRSQDLLASGPILKRPFDYMASALRISGAETDGASGLQDHLEKMGEPLYEWPMPDGYPDKASSWTSSLLPRWNFAFALASGSIRGTGCPGWNEQTLLERPASGAADDKSRLALALAAPDFQWR